MEEDLEKIRRANLSPAAREAEDEQQKQAAEIERANREKIGPKDVLAMILAILSIVLPYVLIFCGVMAVLVFVWFKLIL